MSEFFLELFSEEIPAGLQQNARKILLENFQKLFQEKEILFKMFDMFELEAKSLVEKKISLPAYDQCLKASHVFNILDARGVISVAQRAGYIGRIRDITKAAAESWLNSQIE